MAKGGTSGVMVRRMRVSGFKIRLMAKAYMFGQMEENTTANGKTIICTARVSTLTRMVDNMMANTKIIKDTALVYKLGITGRNTKVGGKMESSTGSASIERMAEIGGVFGKTVKELSGSID